MESIIMDGKMGYGDIRFGVLHGVRYFPLEDICRVLCIFSQSVNTTDGMLANVVRPGESAKTETVVTEVGLKKIVYSKFSERAKRFQAFLEGGTPEQNVVSLQPVQPQMVVPQPEPIPEATQITQSTPNPFEIFTSEEFGKVRIIVEEGNFLFCGSDVAKALGYKNPNKAINDHCRVITKRYSPISGKMQEINYISEGDVYRLISKSKLPDAEKFEHWVFDEVIPSIRKHGAYATEATIDKIIDNPDFGIHLLQQLKAEREQKKVLEAQNAILQPKAEFYDDILHSEGALTTREIAKDYNMSPQQLNAFLEKANIQYNQNGRWFLYQKYAKMGLAKSRTPLKGKTYLVWTEKGRKFIYDLLKSAGIYPNPVN